MSFLFSLSKKHQKWLNIAKLYGCNNNADDVVQDMYINSVKYEANIKRSGTINEGYIYCIIKSICMDIHRKAFQNVELNEAKESIELEIENQYNEKAILADLSEEEYIIYNLYYQRNLTTRDIAKKLDMSNHVYVWRKINTIKEKIVKQLKKQL